MENFLTVNNVNGSFLFSSSETRRIAMDAVEMALPVVDAVAPFLSEMTHAELCIVAHSLRHSLSGDKALRGTVLSDKLKTYPPVYQVSEIDELRGDIETAWKRLRAVKFLLLTFLMDPSLLACFLSP